jgi:hypothetical protein
VRYGFCGPLSTTLVKPRCMNLINLVVLSRTLQRLLMDLIERLQ